MDKSQKIISISLVSISVITWLFSINQPDMMQAMMRLNPIAVTIFTISWTIGMAAMMFPAIIPMVLLYNRLTSNFKINDNNTNNNFLVDSKFNNNAENLKERENRQLSQLFVLLSRTAIKTSGFVATYLLVWALTGVMLLLLWSILMNNLFVVYNAKDLANVSGILLVLSGIYQFSSLKKRCLGYCESPLAFFIKRWKGHKFIDGLKMGLYHGIYCLGCCWPYFLLMVALGWMNILWMGLFAAIIFAEKIWTKGIWIARGTGIVFLLIGFLSITGIMSIVPDGGIHSSQDQMNNSMIMEDSDQGRSSMNMSNYVVMDMDIDMTK